MLAKITDPTTGFGPILPSRGYPASILTLFDVSHWRNGTVGLAFLGLEMRPVGATRF